MSLDDTLTRKFLYLDKNQKEKSQLKLELFILKHARSLLKKMGVESMR